MFNIGKLFVIYNNYVNRTCSEHGTRRNFLPTTVVLLKFVAISFREFGDNYNFKDTQK